MIVSFKELKSYYKNILIKYYKLSLLEEEKFVINKNILYLKSLAENIYFNNNIILKNKKNKKNKNVHIEEYNISKNTINDDIQNNIKNNIENNMDNNINIDNNIDNNINNNKEDNIDNNIINNNIKNMNDNIEDNINYNIEDNLDYNKDNMDNNIDDIIQDENINYSILKILSFYYNLSDINVSKSSNNKYTIQNKKNKYIEYFYNYNNLNQEINNYYTILYDNNKNIENFSVLIQIGNYSTFSKMEHYLQKFIDLEVNIYYTIVEEECIDNNIKKIKKLTPRCTILKTRNMGMDIGLFMINLIYFREKNITPKYILKLHTKTDDRFRNNVLDNLCKNKETILKNLNLFKNSDNIGMITGTFVYNYYKNKSYYDNHINYLNYFSKYIYNNELNLNYLEFAVGTFFYAEYNLFSILDEINLKFLYNKLNNLNTLDINWYKIFYNLHKLSDSEIILHYQKYPTNYGNNLIMQHKTNCLGMRDFMIEHSLERFFGYLCKYNNLNIIEV